MNREEILKLVEQEGNEKDFQYKGYACHIRRVKGMGHLCGYVEIPIGHKLHFVNYTDIEKMYGGDLPSHGGLTFSDCVTGKYWIGFDCAHLGDVLPFSEYTFESLWGDEYRTMEYVETTLKNMVDFIIEEGKK